MTIIPVSKVTYGFASGGSDFPSKTNAQLLAGGGRRWRDDHAGRISDSSVMAK